jgi:hypothetical protein
MDEAMARNLLSPTLALDRDIGAVFDIVATVTDEALRRRFDRAVGALMGFLARGLIFPIEQLHPGLGPAS